MPSPYARQKCSIHERVEGTDHWLHASAKTVSVSIRPISAETARRESPNLEVSFTHKGRCPATAPVDTDVVLVTPTQEQYRVIGRRVHSGGGLNMQVLFLESGDFGVLD